MQSRDSQWRQHSMAKISEHPDFSGAEPPVQDRRPRRSWESRNSGSGGPAADEGVRPTI